MRNLRFLCCVLLPCILLPFVLLLGCGSDLRRQRGSIDRWVELFNGADFDGWTFHSDDPSASLSDAWSVRNGLTIGDGSPKGFLRSTNSFRDYLVEIEWRASPDPDGRAKVLLRTEGDKVWPRSVAVDLSPGYVGELLSIGDYPIDLRGEGARLLGAESGDTAGSWNHILIRVIGSDLEIVLNGKTVNRARNFEVRYGQIALQSSGSRVEYRSMRIKPLDINTPTPNIRDQRPRG